MKFKPMKSLSFFIFFLVLHWSLLGQDLKKAFQVFEKSYQPNELPPFQVLAETAGGTNPYFATGAGGMLQAVLFGFGGLDINAEGVQQKTPQLPKAWKSLTLKGVGIKNNTYILKP